MLDQLCFLTEKSYERRPKIFLPLPENTAQQKKKAAKYLYTASSVKKKYKTKYLKTKSVIFASQSSFSVGSAHTLCCSTHLQPHFLADELNAPLARIQRGIPTLEFSCFMQFSYQKEIQGVIIERAGGQQGGEGRRFIQVSGCFSFVPWTLPPAGRSANNESAA